MARVSKPSATARTFCFKSKQILRVVLQPQFLPNLHETWWKSLPCGVIVFTKFQEDWTKIVDFYSRTIFEILKCQIFFNQSLAGRKCSNCCSCSFWIAHNIVEYLVFWLQILFFSISHKHCHRIISCTILSDIADICRQLIEA